ncbi:type IV pilus twitching motility protein PilT [Stutzerimonas stutzeri]|uniref:type IV pilus twitching motility protein PilT n=1 Tax=Stutzerimonas stutzeri TaxID=316 RepID=UPI0015E388A3|nr:ATPase, T2SS/T4P/T4SS family [Stutzerimonas stutzeri]MBA1280244.1 Flp pilus assembly complex ATPase component TadA [Stutzerimonas stutzeri]
MDAVTPAAGSNAAIMKSLSELGATKSLPAPTFGEAVKVGLESLNQMLGFVLENGVDDLILLAGYPWAVIWSDEIRMLGSRQLYVEELEQLLIEMTGNPNAHIDVGRAKDIDFTYSLRAARGRNVRFRCNATACLGPNGQRGIEIVMRPTGKVPPTMEALGIPDYIRNAALPKSGIVLICGPTGSGKTTLLDSIMRAQATHPQGRHILTYYAPIENDLNIIPEKTGLIAQTEIGNPGYGAHLESFAAATRNSLRRHPMVIAYGEARDRETIEGAVLSAMTGHATYTTTHTSNVHMAISRMADAFSGADRIRITNGLIDNSRLIVHQRLVRRPNGIGRAPIRSALVLTQDIRSELLRTHIDQLPAAMFEAVRSHGIGLLEDAEAQFAAGNIHEDELASIEAEMKSEVL